MVHMKIRGKWSEVQTDLDNRTEANRLIRGVINDYTIVNNVSVLETRVVS